MAVPKEVTGLMEEDDVDALFDDNDVDSESDSDTILDMADAAKSGDVVALGNAIDDLCGLVDEPVDDNASALHLACLYGHLPCVKLLLETGANMEVRDLNDAIPLHYACALGYLDIVKFLLSRASSPECAKRMIETIDSFRETPLHKPAGEEHGHVIIFLLSSGASPTSRNYGE